MSRGIRLALLAFVPVAPALNYLLGRGADLGVRSRILGVGVLTDLIRAATEQLARHTGPAIGCQPAISLGSCQFPERREVENSWSVKRPAAGPVLV